MKYTPILESKYKFKPRILVQYPQPSQDLVVSWKWYDQSQGIVEWDFENKGTITKSGVLFRGILYNGQTYDPYYFGDAFWPVYWENSDGRGASADNPNVNFGVEWATSQTPLTDYGVENNVAPISPVFISSSLWVVAFIFTLLPGQRWSMLEGGFSTQYQPSPIGVYEVTPQTLQAMCIGYNPQAVAQWDAQTQTNLQGYLPNPKTFEVLPYTLANGPEVTVFGDSVTVGACPNDVCGEYLRQAMSDFKKFNLKGGFENIVKAVECLA